MSDIGQNSDKNHSQDTQARGKQIVRYMGYMA